MGVKIKKLKKGVGRSSYNMIERNGSSDKAMPRGWRSHVKWILMSGQEQEGQLRK